MPTDPPAEKRNSSLTQNMEEAADAGYQKQHAVLSDWKKQMESVMPWLPQRRSDSERLPLMRQPHRIDRLFDLSLIRRYV